VLTAENLPLNFLTAKLPLLTPWNLVTGVQSTASVLKKIKVEIN